MKILYTTLALLFVALTATAQEINWLTIGELEAAQAQEPRPVVVDVYTDWCGWCKRMDRETFQNDRVVEYVNANYYAVKVDGEGRQAANFLGTPVTGAQLARKFGVRAYPTVVLMDPTMTDYRPEIGYKNPGQFLNLLASHQRKLARR